MNTEISQKENNQKENNQTTTSQRKRIKMSDTWEYLLSTVPVSLKFDSLRQYRYSYYPGLTTGTTVVELANT